jgi:hypothetical protein
MIPFFRQRFKPQGEAAGNRELRTGLLRGLPEQPRRIKLLYFHIIYIIMFLRW